MAGGEWVRGPFGLDAERGRTVPCQRSVLVVVHHLTAATRLADVVPLLEADRRVQVVFTVPPSSLFSAGADAFLAGLGGVTVPWRQAVQSAFDLAIAASPGLLEQLHAPVLTIPHGTGHNKQLPRWEGPGPQAPRETTGLEQGSLVYRGRVIPSRIIVPTRRDAGRLRRACPPAGGLAVVGGDPCYDRLAASLPLRAAYRDALDAGDRTLVAVTSTCGPSSLLNLHPDLPSRLAAELPRDEYRVALVLHPHIWTWHGRRQVSAWYGYGEGVSLVSPEEGWRGVLAAADMAIGDFGSTTCYAAALGVPVLLASAGAGEVAPGSLAGYLGGRAPAMRPGQALEPQLRAAAAGWDPAVSAAVRARITDVPGLSAAIIRRVMYELMNLPEPAAAALTRPVPVVRPARAPGLSELSL
jgi:hypothetical protein